MPRALGRRVSRMARALGRMIATLVQTAVTPTRLRQMAQRFQSMAACGAGLQRVVQAGGKCLPWLALSTFNAPPATRPLAFHHGPRGRDEKRR